MKNLIEVRFHGRGGQGAKTASQLLAATLMEKGKYIQAFPEYGPERAGAPIKAYTRISDHPIQIHSGVTNPDIVLVIDPTLLSVVHVTEGLTDNGILIINTVSSPEETRKKLNFDKGKVYTVDATKIALEKIKLPLPNTSMLGAFVKATELVTIDELCKQIKSKFIKKIGEDKTNANIESTKTAYEQTKEG